MAFWLAAGGMTIVVLALMILPLLRRRAGDSAATADYDITVYKNQLKEIARERERGVLNDAEAQAAEAEISRRILAADAARKQGGATGDGKAVALLVAAVIVILLPLGAAGLYMKLGQPGLPGRPFAERAAEREQLASRMPAMQDAIDKLTARLEQNPEDVEGWALLGRSYMTLQQYAKAAVAYARAVALEPSAGLRSAYGEALVYAADGMVTERAKLVFEEALEEADTDPRARFYLARAEYQAGNPKEAMEMLIALAQAAPADAAWLPNVREAALSIAAELEVDIAGRLPQVAARDQDRDQDRDRGAPMLTQEQMAAMADMAPEDRQQMIVSMVEGLAERLQDEPDNIQGWARLARAYTVLKRREEALAAYDHILTRMPGDVETLLEKARAIRSFSGEQPTDESAAIMARVLELDGGNLEALWFTGMARLRAGDRAAARDYFNRALATLPADAQEYRDLSAQVERLLAE